jgi:ABC-type uncharacterized transport system involved in gliding motility auxiliary subunit
MSARPALLLAVQIATVSAILACVVALAVLHPRRLDLTPEKRFTLSPYTREVLGRIDGDVHVTVFYSSQAGALRREMADLLDLYHDAAPRISVRYLDLDRSPGAAKRLGADSYNTAVVEAGDRREVVALVNEENMTAALLAIAGTPPVATYFVVGHGEHDPRDDDERRGASEAARALATEGFLVRVLEGAASIPDDAGLVVLAGPTRELTPAESDALAAYVQGGGNALVLADPGTPRSVAALLARFGIELLDDLVVDERGRLFGTDGLSARVAYLNQELIQSTTEAQGLLPEAQTLRLLDVPGVRAEYLATTAEDSWADVSRDARHDGPATFRPGEDRHGPLPIAAFARVGAEDHEGRLVAIGDADFITNLHLNVLGNRDLLLATAGLVARAQALAAARPAAPPGGTFSPLTLTDRQARLVFWLGVMAPTAVLASVALVLARRRRFA